MKKLKIKLFSTIFIILTIFVLFVLGINQYRNYDMQKKSISNILNKLPNSLEKKNPPPKKDRENHLDDIENNKFFLDFTVYTIILDESGNYRELINHSESNANIEKIKKVAKNIIATRKENMHIGNLYSEKYSYYFSTNNTLTIVDNTNIHNKLVRSLVITIILFFLLELLILLISILLTRWIIKPVMVSFQKQKEFIEDASHELKTPLSVILASADAYFINKEDRWVENIKEEAEKTSKLVLEMLELAKTEKQNHALYTKKDLSKLVKKSLLTFESMMFEKKIHLIDEIEDDIELFCNKEQIEKLVYILLDNAVEHSYIQGEILVALKKNNKEIILEVTNTGEPIKESDLENIFERFYRADESRNRSKCHYGLGLAIAKNIVIQHHGKIEVFSKDNYTTFMVSLF